VTPTKVAPAPAPPNGTLFFVHGANETSEGLSQNLSRIEDQIRARGWDVTVVGPEWRRRSGLRLGNWRKAVYRRGKPAAIPLSSLPTGVGKAAVMKLVTNYFEDRRESMLEALGTQLLADVLGYDQHRDSVQAVLKEELTRAARVAGDRPVLPVGLSLGGLAVVDLLASWPEAPVEACVTVGSQAPLLYTFNAIPSMPYDEIDPPHLPVPWLNIYDSRDFLSFLAEPLFRRTDGLASVVDLRVHSRKDFPKSHSAYWELAPVWDAMATAFAWRRTEPLTVKQARDLGFEARKRAVPRT
jgi:pimeloyl-ACP methyl ester carboxylesterase